LTREPVWLLRSVVLAVHEEQLAQHGGMPGIRDENLLESALARPRNLYAYGNPTLVELGAAYAASITRNHPFLDGNKRTGFLAMFIFLARNGVELTATQAEASAAMLALAEGSIAEDQLVRWIEDHTRML
jgi:death on curing protein